jgi:hypothetical protein
MTAPNVPIQINLPPNGNQPETYGDLLNVLDCQCIAGALLTPSLPPTAAIDIGDFVADLAKYLSYFTSIYKVITIILKVIACIMDIICAIPNPFAMIAAIIRFFTVCFPELLSLFPQFALLLLLICLIKIIISIIEYILFVLIPLIEDVIENLLLLKKMMDEDNAEAVMAISFKVVSIFEELRSLLGLLALLQPILDMINSLLSAGINFSCMGDGGSCDDCDTPEPQCPPVLQNPSIDGTDGCMFVLYGEKGPFDFQLVFNSREHRSDFVTVSNFFPPGINYDEITKEEDLAFSLETDNNTYAVTRGDLLGNLYVSQIPSELSSDGYLCNTWHDGTILVDPEIKFASASGEFTQLLQLDSYGYMTIKDTRKEATSNSGTWEIKNVYDDHNILLTKLNEEDVWAGDNSQINPTPNISWQLAPVSPSAGCGKAFSVVINHTELIRHSMISLGCHPAVKASIQSVANRYPDISNGLGPNLGLPPDVVPPDAKTLLANVTAVIDKVAPKNMDIQYVMDNYAAIEAGVVNIIPEISDYLNNFKQDSLDYLGEILPRVIDVEKSTFDATPRLQLVGVPILLSLSAYDRSGQKVGKGLPLGTVLTEISTTAGEISKMSEVVDGYGNITGDFTGELNSSVPIKATLTASVLGRPISDFNGYNLIPRTIDVEFVYSTETVRRSGIGTGTGAGTDADSSTEPVGMGSK